jgi:hypothetical protein
MLLLRPALLPFRTASAFDRWARSGIGLARTGLAMLGIAGLGFVGSARAQDASHSVAPKTVIELFTSQGCSACPPADKLLGEYAKQPGVIALTLAVDYWDYLGWKDTLAKHGHSVRQKAYAKARGDGKMFTPQAVVNGKAMTIGSDRAGLEHGIATVPKLSVPVTVDTSSGKLKVSVGAGEGAGEVWLCPLSREVDVEIGRGENEGTKIGYHNVVRGWTKLGDWTGEATSFEAPLKGLPGDNVDSIAVLVQSGSALQPGPIVGAALSPLP